MITYRAINTTNGKFYIGSSKSWGNLRKKEKNSLKIRGNFLFSESA
jgi:hypothetical protein